MEGENNRATSSAKINIVACVLTLVDVGAIVLIVMGSICMQTGKTGMCHNNYESSVAMVSTGSAIFGLMGILMLVVGSVCLKTKNYEMCGGERNIAIVLTILGSIFTALDIGGITMIMMVFKSCNRNYQYGDR